jgi:hypothetical protein
MDPIRLEELLLAARNHGMPLEAPSLEARLTQTFVSS